MSVVIDSHLHVWDETAAGKDPGPMRVGYSAQAMASVELFMDYMDEAGVKRAVFVQPWFYVKLSGFHHWCRERHPYRDGMPFVEAAVRAFGADRCMWGSDFPHVLAGCGYVRNRNLLPREATFLSKSELDASHGRDRRAPLVRVGRSPRCAAVPEPRH